MTTTSKISSVGDGQATSDVLLLGAAGNSGKVIAAELAARGLSLRLAGRRRPPLEDLARALAAAGARADVRAVDVSDRGSLAEAVTGAGVVLSAIGPFARQAGPVIDACLTAGVAGAAPGAWTSTSQWPNSIPTTSRSPPPASTATDAPSGSWRPSARPRTWT